MNIGEWLLRWLSKLLPTDAEKWDMAAHAMETDGYTDLDIVLELGPRPKDKKDEP